MPNSMDNVVMQIVADERGSFGDGISRPMPDALTSLYRVRVKLPGNQPMIVTMAAENRNRAALYASNRWPQAAVEVLP